MLQSDTDMTSLCMCVGKLFHNVWPTRYSEAAKDNTQLWSLFIHQTGLYQLHLLILESVNSLCWHDDDDDDDDVVDDDDDEDEDSNNDNNNDNDDHNNHDDHNDDDYDDNYDHDYNENDDDDNENDDSDKDSGDNDDIKALCLVAFWVLGGSHRYYITLKHHLIITTDDYIKDHDQDKYHCLH